MPEMAKVESMSEKQISDEIKRLKTLMVEHAKDRDFEKAAQVQDQLHALKQQAFGAPDWTMWGDAHEVASTVKQSQGTANFDRIVPSSLRRPTFEHR